MKLYIKYNELDMVIREKILYNDSVYKDRLNSIITSTNTINYTYNINNPFFVSHIGINDTDIDYTFKSSNLVRYIKNDLDYKYYYDSNNCRIKKELNNNDYVNYYYENELLIKEEIIKPNNTYEVTYLYDINNILYGFVYNDERYYYKRNIFKEIIGIVDTNGNDICEYKYSGRFLCF